MNVNELKNHTKYRIVSEENIKLQPVPPSMPLEALLIPDNLAVSDSDGIGGGTGCNFIFLYIYVFLRVHSPGYTFGYFWLKFLI